MILATLTRVRVAARRKLGLTDDEGGPMPAEAIGRARQEMTDPSQPDTAKVGKAVLKNYSGEFTNDLKAVVPLRTAKYEDPAPLTFDPDGDQLERFCAAYGVDVDGIGALRGASVPLKWEQGAPVPNWEALDELTDDDQEPPLPDDPPLGKGELSTKTIVDDSTENPEAE